MERLLVQDGDEEPPRGAGGRAGTAARPSLRPRASPRAARGPRVFSHAARPRITQTDDRHDEVDVFNGPITRMMTVAMHQPLGGAQRSHEVPVEALHDVSGKSFSDRTLCAEEKQLVPNQRAFGRRTAMLSRRAFWLGSARARATNSPPARARRPACTCASTTGTNRCEQPRRARARCRRREARAAARPPPQNPSPRSLGGRRAKDWRRTRRARTSRRPCLFFFSPFAAPPPSRTVSDGRASSRITVVLVRIMRSASTCASALAIWLTTAMVLSTCARRLRSMLRRRHRPSVSVAVV